MVIQHVNMENLEQSFIDRNYIDIARIPENWNMEDALDFANRLGWQVVTPAASKVDFSIDSVQLKDPTPELVYYNEILIHNGLRSYWL